MAFEKVEQFLVTQDLNGGAGNHLRGSRVGGGSNVNAWATEMRQRLGMLAPAIEECKQHEHDGDDGGRTISVVPDPFSPHGCKAALQRCLLEFVAGCEQIGDQPFFVRWLCHGLIDPEEIRATGAWLEAGGIRRRAR